MTAFSLEPVAFVRGGRAQAIDDDWGKSRARLELAPHIPDEALAGLADFSHAEVVFVFDQVGDEAERAGLLA